MVHDFFLPQFPSEMAHHCQSMLKNRSGNATRFNKPLAFVLTEFAEIDMDVPTTVLPQPLVFIVSPLEIGRASIVFPRARTTTEALPRFLWLELLFTVFALLRLSAK